jgi:hypothetical protein
MNIKKPIRSSDLHQQGLGHRESGVTVGSDCWNTKNLGIESFFYIMVVRGIRVTRAPATKATDANIH